MLDRLRRFEVQANWALCSAIVSLVPFFAAAWLAASRYDSTLGRIIYGAKGQFVLAFAVALVASVAPAAVGFLLGLNSASQRRNDQSSRSWTGFFLGGAILSADIVLLIAFYMLRLERPM